ncbi:MAG: hypothetical protein A2848_03105 [Candidatus Magasanikbacteria bacterium RIFCSPHIGHO2_01_FULL_50_8]|uniref:NIF system FeS cluster assembly NifU C-terminal domain-containing protein n=2 Tax=Candidatus Magasanikiibacteriota TaxID=1752731 RepID=A0A1F6LRJ6_9BACT|nr:MAG: hypothetical protein A2848_03105 [Candidatus Magasanikbacteria bacterium RIFCSPHIGHO2_01_FULL_50_8]OGH67638.1 MAG: hypothetical protein A3C15_02330 [Candidatus Magasanikbacteria bacterium RIFCSPHIGHO2_02_FULL_50_9b]
MSRSQAEIEADIKKALTERIAPMLAVHRGGAEMVSFDHETGILMIRFLGTCVGCPMSTLTLKAGVEQELLDAVPEIQEVRAEGVEEEDLEFIGEE